MSAPRIATPASLVGFYLLYFATVGISLPFFPAYFRSLGFSGAQIGLLLALSPVAALVCPPFFGHLADRSGRPDRVLSFVTFGALVSFAPLLISSSYEAVFAAFVAFAIFASSHTTLIDTLALHRVAQVGGSYSHLRVFGSVGFVISSTLFGFAVDAIDRRTVYAAFAAICAYALWSLTVRARSAPAPGRNPLDGLRLLRDPDITLLLTATCLHWIASAPYNGTLSIHVTELGLLPNVVGLSAGLGVFAEVVVMTLYPRFGERLAPRHILFVSFALSVARWIGMALVDSGPAIIALSSLHGFTFGAFYIASVGYMARRVPAHLRSSGQALYVAITFGIGGIVGYLGSGAGYDLLGGHRLFAVAAVVQAVAALLTLRLRPADQGREFPLGAARPEQSHRA